MNDQVQIVPIDRIRILNPRHRDRKKFEAIVQSIRNLGLKKPIQVSLRATDEAGGLGYDLVCGQGRIEAFLALGHKEIPALVVEVSKEDRLLRSLVENMARRFAAPLELLQEIDRLKAQGYSNVEIGKKLDLPDTTVGGFIALNKAGEERLLQAAIAGKIPLGVAVDIAKTDSVETQRELLKAYENKQLNQVSIRAVKRLIEQRRFFGKKRGAAANNPRPSRTSAESLVNTYKRERQRQKLLIRKAKICDAKLVFIVTAFSKLMANENLVNLLRAESLATMPKCLWGKLGSKHKEAA
ncbi:MAG: ParB N-terminal domain-containing protein [Verrucomicrobiales bacterium]|nr:ParB N-terminal domain-containing protein [Verrucomicrobiales bacterium]